jgi:hypothetical protein
MKPNILAIGIDSLNVGFNILNWNIEQTSFEHLAEAKADAGSKLFGGKGVTVNWQGKEFMVSAKGSKGYEYVMFNNDVRLYLAKDCYSGRVYPEVFAQLNSCYLWGKGYNRAFFNLKQWLGEWALIDSEKVNRVDLCVDLDFDLPDIDIKKEVVTRARKKVDYTQIEHYTNGLHDTGYRIGANEIMMRIYDKSYEMKSSEKYWFKDIWTPNGWDGKSNVTRVEFQNRRKYLKDFSVNSYDDMIKIIPDIWRVNTHEWLVLKERNNKDKNHRRWKTSELWEAVQEAGSQFGECLGVQRWKQKQAKLEPIEAQMKGLIVSQIALDSTVRGEYFAIGRLKEKMNEYLESPEFRRKLVERRGRYASM